LKVIDNYSAFKVVGFGDPLIVCGWCVLEALVWNS